MSGVLALGQGADADDARTRTRTKGGHHAMQRFLIRRLLQSVLLLVLLTIAFFLLVHAIPGGPEQAFFSPRQTAAQKQAIIKEFGLDQPLPIQYVKWLSAALHGDFGRSYDSNLPVLTDISTAIPNTVLLFLVALS